MNIWDKNRFYTDHRWPNDAKTYVFFSNLFHQKMGFKLFMLISNGLMHVWWEHYYVFFTVLWIMFFRGHHIYIVHALNYMTLLYRGAVPPCNIRYFIFILMDSKREENIWLTDLISCSPDGRAASVAANKFKF